MDAIIGHVKALSGDKDQLTDILNKSDRNLHAQAAAIAPQLGQLQLPDHTLGYGWLLAVKADHVAAEEVEWFVGTASTYIQLADAENINGPKFATICQKLAECSIASGRPQVAISALREAVGKLQPSRQCLTPAHVSFVQVCLKAKNYHVALPIIEERIIEVNPKKTGLVPRDILLFFLYAGRVQIGVKNFAA